MEEAAGAMRIRLARQASKQYGNHNISRVKDHFSRISARPFFCPTLKVKEGTVTVQLYGAHCSPFFPRFLWKPDPGEKRAEKSTIIARTCVEKGRGIVMALQRFYICPVLFFFLSFSSYDRSRGNISAKKRKRRKGPSSKLLFHRGGHANDGGEIKSGFQLSCSKEVPF